MSDSESLIYDIERAIEEDRLSLDERESDFIESCKRYASNGWDLSDKMDTWLEAIWKRTK